MKKKILLSGLCVLILLGAFCIKVYFYDHKFQEPAWVKLDSVFPVNDISKVTVSNFYGTHVLSADELNDFKTQLMGAQSMGGLEVKPGHISITLELKDSTIVRAYGSTGLIHFDTGSIHGCRGTFHLPDPEFNYDNYR